MGHGITTLGAASDIADGMVLSQICRRHRAAEFNVFLVAIGKTVPEQLDVHVICDNASVCKAPAIKARPERHPRFHLDFTATGYSSVNRVGAGSAI